MFLASFLLSAVLSASLVAQTWDDEMNYANSLAAMARAAKRNSNIKN